MITVTSHQLDIAYDHDPCLLHTHTHTHVHTARLYRSRMPINFALNSMQFLIECQMNAPQVKLQQEEVRFILQGDSIEHLT
jgi:hypothetical protein